MLTAGYYIHIKFDSKYHDIYYKVDSKMKGLTILKYINKLHELDIESIVDEIYEKEDIINYLTDEEYSDKEDLCNILGDMSYDIFLDCYAYYQDNGKSIKNNIESKLIYIKSIDCFEIN